MKAPSLPLGVLFLINFWTRSGWAQYNHNYCPETCDSVGTPTLNWNVFPSVERLSWCKETMLVSFNIHNDPNNPDITVRLGACTTNATNSVTSQDIPLSAAENLRASRRSVQASPEYRNLTTNSTEGSWLHSSSELVDVQMLSSGTSGAALSSNVILAASALQIHLPMEGSAKDKTFMAAYSNGAMVGVYSGSVVADNSTNDLLQLLIDTIDKGSTANTIILQICGTDRNARKTLGVISYADPTSQDLGEVQRALAIWNNASCIDLGEGSQSTTPLTVYQTPFTPTVQDLPETPTGLAARASATCTAIQVVSGNGCSDLAAECGITPAQFTIYNPSSTLCSTLVAGEWVCCSAGTLPDFSPKPYANGTCYTYYVNVGDSCSSLAATYSLTVAKINGFNNNTWGWTGCTNLLADETICLSSGNPPMPAVISNAVCGPQVAGTSYPASGVTLASLNPCPLNACCDIWGQCGITSEFCTNSSASTGAPGTAAAGQNGCISNCGTNIIRSSTQPSSFATVGYFLGSNWDRSCLNMEATDIPTSFTHVHFAFATLTTAFGLDLGDQMFQWNMFVSMAGFKRIISIGGWAFSTDPSTYDIFRQAVTAANRNTLIANIVAFYNLDGVDIDWEYPGAPDIPGIPPGNTYDGLNYYITLALLKQALPSTVTLSIAAPASYWYLKQFKIAPTASYVDYIVLMTYDLHGQWDYGNTWTSPGCPTGACLRSHVNYTETMSALSMITKAGVPSSKIAVGVASYARSFKMVDPSCTGPTCLFTGPLSGAEPGICTGVAGYISNSEIALIKANSSISSTEYADNTSGNTVLVWDGNWAAYMNDATKQNRAEAYTLLNMFGSSDWAIDLQASIQTTPSGSIVMHETGGGNSTAICGMTWTTSGGTTIASASQSATNTWNNSGAGTFLHNFLTSYLSTHQSLQGWPLAFFEAVVPGSSGGTTFDCSSFDSNKCGAPIAAQCTTYTPPEAFFVHVAIWQLFDFYKSFYQGVINNGVSKGAYTINQISDTFAPPDTTQALLFAVIGGILTTVAGLATFVGDFGLDGLGAAGDGMAAFSAMFQATQLGSTPSSTTTEALDEAFGQILEDIYKSVNTSISTIFNPASTDNDLKNITFIESFFKDGAFLNSQVVDYMLKQTLAAWNSTVDQYLVVQAMEADSNLGAYSSGYCFLYSDTQYNTQSACASIGEKSMIWYNNTCIGFGKYTSSVSSGQNGVQIQSTYFLDSSNGLDAFASYTPNPADLSAAIINNYNCMLHPVAATSWSASVFNPFSPIQYPPCFYNLGAYTIDPA